MKNLYSQIGLAVLFFAAACTQQTPADKEKPFDLESVKTHINKANETYGLRAKGDPAFFASVYTQGAWVMPAGVPKITGMGNIIAFFKAPADAPPFSVKVTAEEIFGNADNVIETGTYELLDDEGASFEKGKFVVVWRQEGGSWKIHREIWTADAEGN
ncbi:MAG: YybH family protein [Saprospiraceae bacterium]